MLIGREAETARLGQLLAAARLGTSGALLLRGVAGIGKTALLAQTEAEAVGQGFLVLRATGIESEEELPYATLHQLLRPLEDRIGGLADLQAQALRGALGLGEERQADRFLVGVGTLTLLADAAEHQPVLALLDDASWFDRASLDALSFTARRLHAECVALLFAVRDEPDRRFALPGVKELRVDRLDDADAQKLLDNGVDARRRDEVIARAAGNPLALIELGRATANGTPVATGAEQAYVDRIGGLPDDTRSLLLLAAADTTTLARGRGRRRRGARDRRRRGARACRDRWPRARERRRDRVPPPARALGGVPHGAVRASAHGRTWRWRPS